MMNKTNCILFKVDICGMIFDFDVIGRESGTRMHGRSTNCVFEYFGRNTFVFYYYPHVLLLSLTDSLIRVLLIHTISASHFPYRVYGDYSPMLYIRGRELCWTFNHFPAFLIEFHLVYRLTVAKLYSLIKPRVEI